MVVAMAEEAGMRSNEREALAARDHNSRLWAEVKDERRGVKDGREWGGWGRGCWRLVTVAWGWEWAACCWGLGRSSSRARRAGGV